jgi:hypothetical protein
VRHGSKPWSLGATMRKSLPIVMFAFLFAPLLHAQSLHKGSSSKFEDKVMDTVASLKEVVERAKYVHDESKAKRRLQYVIWEKYYWVKVMEDNGVSLYTHFNFYVYPNTMTIKYLDTDKNTPIDLATLEKK